MQYLLVCIALLLLELIYFRVADRMNIIDKPNERSSHTQITLRGGGVVFYFAVAIYSFLFAVPYPYFFVGCTAIAIISFLDDMYTLSNKLRLAVHAFAIMMLFCQIEITLLPLWIIPCAFIVGIGIFNAYNFMDGINGITAVYSLTVIGLLYKAQLIYNFIDPTFLIYLALSLLVFAWFNFRNKAKTFAGDVGSMTIAFCVVFALGLLMVKTSNPLFIMFISVYGVDVVMTIIERLKRGENIFKAHRLHLYQLLSNECKANRLIVSTFYGIIQLIVGVIVFYFIDSPLKVQFLISSCLLVVLLLIYVLIKNKIKTRFF